MKKLSILVTHYKEPWKVCHFLFDSIAFQQGINHDDIEVIVVNDGSEGALDMEWYSELYDYDIHHYIRPKGGVSKTRNNAFDVSTGEYVMWCDCDDAFCNAYALKLILEAMEEKPDIIVPAFVEEIKVDEKMVLHRHDKDFTFVHGKAYKRAFLIEKGLKFKDELTIHEDGYFNCLCFYCTDRKKFLGTPIYAWKWRDDSVVRRDMNAFVLRTYDHLIKARTALCKQLFERRLTEQAEENVLKTVVDCYYDFQKPDFVAKENLQLRMEAERYFARYYKRYRTVFEASTKEKIAEIMHLSRERALHDGMLYEKQSLTDWINHIVKTY